jgi:chaperonin cofactor prefoldin
MGGNTIIQCDCPDYTEYLQSILDNQEAEIEQLEHQTEILMEEINGLSLIVNYQFATIGIVVIFSVVLAAWKILSKWFFGGV